MRSCFNIRAMAVAIAILASFLATSCVNDKFDLSKENLDLNVTVFQEGISLPLGSTDKISLDQLFSKLEGDASEILQLFEGAYMFRKSDVLEVEDIAEALSGFEPLEAISMEKTFDFELENVDVSEVTVEGRHINPEPIDLTELLEDFDVDDLNENLPIISESLPAINVAVPTPETENLELNLSSIADKLTKETEIAKLSRILDISQDVLNNPLAGIEMDYSALRNAFPQLSLPELVTAFEFDPFTVEVPVEFSLPKEIKSVKSIELAADASFELIFEIQNSLFTSGSVVPVLDIDLHNLLYIDRIESGIDDGALLEDVDTDNDGVFEQHVKDRLVMSSGNGWKSHHIYHVESLAIKPSDWKQVGDNLVIDKVIPVTMSGELLGEDLKTTLRHLGANGDKAMKVKMDIKFNNFKIDDVQMELNPIVQTQVLEIPISIENVDLGTDMVKKVDYFDLDPEKPLTIALNTVLPDKLKSLDLNLKSLEIEFPEGMVVNDKESAAVFDEKSRKLVYSNVSLNSSFNDEVVIERVYLPDLVNNTLSYSGTVKVTAEAVAEGCLSSKELIEGEEGDLIVSGSVTYEPKLKDFAVDIDDYVYDIDFEPIIIHKTLAKEVGEFIGSEPLIVSLKKDAAGKNPMIEIYINYPEHSAINIAPKQGVGFQLDFPDMLRFNQQLIPSSYNYNANGNTLTFTSEDVIPKSIVLEIENIALMPEKAAESDGYVIDDEMTVTGGVYLKGTTIHMSDVEELKKMDNAVVSFEAKIPDIEPAQFGVKEYEKTLETTIEIEKIEVELPEGLGSIELQELQLKDTYLNVTVDATSVKKVVGDVDMTLMVEIVLPEIFMIQSESEGVKVENHVLKINEKLGKDYKLTIDGIRVAGLDLSKIEIKDGKLAVDVEEIPVKGTVKLENLNVDIEKLKGETLTVNLNGYLASVDENKKALESIEIDKVTAYIGYELDPVSTSVDLSGLSEVINEGDVDLTLDLHTYYLALDIKTNIDVPVKGSLSVIPYFGKNPGTAQESVLVLDPAERKNDCYNIFVSNLNPNSAESEGRYDAYKDYQYISLDLISMLYKKDETGQTQIADSLQVAINAGTDSKKLCTIEPSKQYNFGVEYEIGMPAELGESFAVEYRQTISDFDKETAEIFEYGSVGLAGKFVNGLPLNLEVQLIPLDSQNNPIPVSEGVGRQRIASCDKKGNPVTTDLRFVFSGKGTDFSDLSAIDVVLRVDAKGAGGVPLKPDSFVKVSLSALVPEGLTLDLSTMLEDGDEN